MKKTLKLIATFTTVAFFLLMAFGSDEGTSSTSTQKTNYEYNTHDSEPEIKINTEEEMNEATDMPIMENVEETE